MSKIYSSNIPSVNSVLELRNFTFTATDNMVVLCTGNKEYADGLGSMYVFDSSNTSADNGVTIIQPNGMLVGRYVMFNSNLMTLAASITDGSTAINVKSLESDGGLIKSDGAGTLTSKTINAEDLVLTGEMSIPTAAITSDSQSAVNIPMLNMFLPKGTILQFNGDMTGIDTTIWAYCDGTNGTVDMRNRYMICSATNTTTTGTQVGTTSDLISTTDGHQLTVDEMPSHNHNYNAPGFGGFRTSGTDSWNPCATYTNNWDTGSTGGNQAHSHTYTIKREDANPPSVNVHFIQKII